MQWPRCVDGMVGGTVKSHSEPSPAWCALSGPDLIYLDSRRRSQCSVNLGIRILDLEVVQGVREPDI